MKSPDPSNAAARQQTEEHRSKNLKRPKIVQRICGRTFIFFGTAVLLISIYKFFRTFSVESPPWQELQLSATAIILIIIGNYIQKSTLLRSLLSELNFSTHIRRSYLIFALTVIIMSGAILLKLSVQDVLRYKRLLGEGGILEYLQALILFTSAWISWLISRDLWKRLSLRLHGVIYSLISFSLLFIGLEEIAWGQVLFGWKTPENIATLNAQNQTTFHNLKLFQNYLDLNLFLVSMLLLVLILWRPTISLLRPATSKAITIHPKTFFIPRYFWPLYFCAALLSYFVATESGTAFVINIDQEWAEFLLYLSAGLSLLRTYILLGNVPKTLKHE